MVLMPLVETGEPFRVNRRTATAWGKLSRDRSGQLASEHPLLDHMTDVAACFLALAECNSVRRSLENTAGRALDSADLQRLAVLVFLHDVGKANAGFQSRRWQLPDRPPGNWPTTPFGHGPEGWELIAGRVSNAEHYAAGLPIAEIVAWGEAAACELLQAGISHHGRPLGVNPGKEAECIWKPVLDKTGAVLYDPATTLASMGERVKHTYPLAFSECQKPLPDQPAFVHFFAGLVQLADWLGSDIRVSGTAACCAPCSAACASGVPGLESNARSTLPRNTRPGANACRTSPWPMTSASRLMGWCLPTACTSSHWPIPDGATPRSSIPARASWHCPPDCRPHSGPWAAYRKSTAPTVCRPPSTTWPSRKS